MKTISRHFPLILLAAVLTAFGIYAYLYIQATSFVINGVRYYNLFDDAMVSMRYAWNLVHGSGAVWNAGERVEGYTNPLWMLYMAFWQLFPIPTPVISLPLQISGAVFLGMNLVFVYKIVRHLSSDVFALLAALLMIAFYGPLDVWAMLGMEVSLLTLVLSAATWIALTRDLQRWTPWLYLLLGVSTLVRIDMAVPFGLIVLFLLLTQPAERKKNLAWAIGTGLVFIGGQTLFRLWYYGDIFPNTYYLKMVGLSQTIRIARGFWVLFELAWQMNWVVFFLPLAVFLFRRDKGPALLALLFAGQVAYSTYVGGDAWEHNGGANRFISIAIPLWFALFGIALAGMRQAVVDRLQLKRAVSIGTSYGVMVLLLAFSIWNANFLLADYHAIERWTLVRKPDYIQSHEKYIRTALILQDITLPGAKIAVTAAGTEPYYLPDRYAIDLLGKADKVIAHEPVKYPVSLAAIQDVRPGHMKWDYAYSLGKLKPDVIVQLWEDDYKGADPYMGDYEAVSINGLPLFLRKGSSMIVWDKVKQ
jgi:hypothetical protein